MLVFLQDEHGEVLHASMIIDAVLTPSFFYHHVTLLCHSISVELSVLSRTVLGFSVLVKSLKCLNLVLKV